MSSIFQIDPNLDVPIYQQLVDKIRTGIKMGKLTPGQQLPTVQELTGELAVSRGTVKRAYDELEHQGLLEKVQGRGTFIRYLPANSVSRKEQAMAAIDEMLDQLENMGFSSEEINIFLTLKQRERAEKQSALKVAVVECNPEALSQLSGQLRHIKGIDLYSYLLGTVQEYPYNLDDETDVVITTGSHAQYIESILPDKKKLIRIALRLSMDSLSGILRLRSGERVGILSGSSRFGMLMHSTCQKYTRNVELQQPRQFSAELDVAGYLKDKDAVLVPKDYEKYCNAEAGKLLRRLKKQERLILCSYEMDEGSVLHLEEKLKLLRQKKAR